MTYMTLEQELIEVFARRGLKVARITVGPDALISGMVYHIETKDVR